MIENEHPWIMAMLLGGYVFFFWIVMAQLWDNSKSTSLAARKIHCQALTLGWLVVGGLIFLCLVEFPAILVQMSIGRLGAFGKIHGEMMK